MDFRAPPWRHILCEWVAGPFGVVTPLKWKRMGCHGDRPAIAFYHMQLLALPNPIQSCRRGRFSPLLFWIWLQNEFDCKVGFRSSRNCNSVGTTTPERLRCRCLFPSRFPPFIFSFLFFRRQEIGTVKYRQQHYGTHQIPEKLNITS